MTEYQLIPSSNFGKERILLYSGKFSIFEEPGQNFIELDGEIFMKLGATFEIVFEGIVISDKKFLMQRISKCNIETPTGFSGHGFAGKRTLGKVNRVEGIVSQFSTNISKEQVNKYIVHVANSDFIYHGFSVRFKNSVFSSHVPIEADDWSVGLQGGYDHETQKPVKISEEQFNYGLTHIIEIRKKDNSKFNKFEVLSLLESISAALSLSSGRKVGFPIHEGFLENEQLFTEYWNVYMDRYKNKSTWFPEYKPTILMEVLPLLHSKFKNPYLKVALTRSIHLFTEANQTTFVGQPAVYTQVALETVWWVILTQLEESPITIKLYEELRPAFKRMQEMAGVLQIDTGFPDFQTLTLKGTDIKDFPILFTRYRNHLSHPRPNPVFDSINKWDEWEIANWGLWYLEMGILFIIGYDGEYADRRRNPRAAGIYEYVPWSKKKE